MTADNTPRWESQPGTPCYDYALAISPSGINCRVVVMRELGSSRTCPTYEAFVETEDGKPMYTMGKTTITDSNQPIDDDWEAAREFAAECFRGTWR